MEFPPTTMNSQGLHLMFYYHMQGSGVGHLKVTADIGQGDDVIVWSRSGYQGSEWMYVCENLLTNVFPVGQDISLKFTSVRGNSSVGDIAVDQVRVAVGTCPGKDKDYNINVCKARNVKY